MLTSFLFSPLFSFFYPFTPAIHSHFILFIYLFTHSSSSSSFIFDYSMLENSSLFFLHMSFLHGQTFCFSHNSLCFSLSPLGLNFSCLDCDLSCLPPSLAFRLSCLPVFLSRPSSPHLCVLVRRLVSFVTCLCSCV